MGFFTLVDLLSGCGVGVVAGVSSSVVSGGVWVGFMAGVGSGVAGGSGECEVDGGGM